jgi:hypothetical protein
MKLRKNKPGVVMSADGLTGGSEGYSGVSSGTIKVTALGPARSRAKKLRLVAGEVISLIVKGDDGVFRTFDGHGKMLDHWTEEES